jgi:succinate dehydrogenase/fumarate reductase flavoprotein subunit
MAGLSAAAYARELGAVPVVYEKGARAGGSMLLSSCVIWRFREWDDFRAECPTGDDRLQRIVWEQLDDGIAWLEALGAPVVKHETGNPRTIGKRFDPRGLTETLVRAAGDVRLRETTDEPTILATGGFQGDPELVREHIHPDGELRLRANPWSVGDGMRHALRRGAALSAGLDEFYGRNMPDADYTEEQFVPLAQLYGRVARVFNERGEEFFEGEVSWSENDLVQATAQQPGARAWYLLDDEALQDADVARRVERAPTRTEPAGLPFRAPEGTRVAVRVKPGITHTIGGLRVDEHARVADGLYAAGADVGGISTGGYASGLAAALVFGRVAAESALGGL